MINNISKTSGTFRIVLGLTFLFLFITNAITGMAGLTLFSISGVLLISGFFRSSPILYFFAKKEG
jgi:hypothetical protein